MRVLFCGSGEFAVQPLQAISASRHEVAGVITQPARPAGRGGKLRATPLAEAAGALRLAPAELADINSPDALARVRQIAPDVICVIDFAQLVGAPVRSSARLGAFNLHPSLLPELRGAAPVNWAIIRGYRRTGVTTFSLADRMDAGPIYAAEATDIRPDETAEELRDRLAELGAHLACRTLDMLEAGGATPRPQDESRATKAPRLKKADGQIDFSTGAETVRNLIHGTWPWPGGQAVFRRRDGRDVPVTIARAAVEPVAANAEPGTLDRRTLVATGDIRLRIEQIKPAGRKLMAWRDFVNGYRVGEGDRFLKMG